MLGAVQALAAPVISIDITSAGGGYGYSNTTETVANPDGTFGMSGVAGGAAVGAAFDCDWSVVVNPDPQITSIFTLTNISGVTQSFIMNVTLPIASIAGPTVQGGYYGDAVNGTVYTDNNNNGVTLATVGANPFYSALVNSINLSQGLGSWTLTATPGTSGDTSQENWGTPIPSAPFGPASGNIRIRWQFSLTSGDSVQTKGFFQVEPTAAPEPATIALVGLGLAALVVARRRA
jgi:hypothetical protein